MISGDGQTPIPMELAQGLFFRNGPLGETPYGWGAGRELSTERPSWLLYPLISIALLQVEEMLQLPGWSTIRRDPVPMQ